MGYCISATYGHLNTLNIHVRTPTFWSKDAIYIALYHMYLRLACEAYDLLVWNLVFIIGPLYRPALVTAGNSGRNNYHLAGPCKGTIHYDHHGLFRSSGVVNPSPTFWSKDAIHIALYHIYVRLACEAYLTSCCRVCFSNWPVI